MEIRTIAVIGAGTFGRALAWRALRGGFGVVLEDFSPTTLEHAVPAILRKLIDNRDKQGELHVSHSAVNLSTSLNVEDAIRDADLVVETAADELETKLELFTIFDKFAKPGAILATTSRIHRVTEIAEITSCAERCIAILPDPADDPTSLRVAPGKQTSPDTVNACVEVCERLVESVSVIL